MNEIPSVVSVPFVMSSIVSQWCPSCGLGVFTVPPVPAATVATRSALALWRAWLGSAATMACLLINEAPSSNRSESHAKAVVAVTNRRVVAAAIRRTTAPCEAEPRPTTEHAVRGIRRSRRI